VLLKDTTNQMESVRAAKIQTLRSYRVYVSRTM